MVWPQYGGDAAGVAAGALLAERGRHRVRADAGPPAGLDAAGEGGDGLAGLDLFADRGQSG